MSGEKVIRRRQKTSVEPSRMYDGVSLPQRPDEGVPEIPLDISDINDTTLMNLFARYVAWQNFIALRLTEAEIAEANVATELRVGEAEALVSNWTGAKEDRVTIARAERTIDPEVRSLQDRYDTARAHRKMLDTLASNMERAAALVSREITRRVGREPLERRVNKWTP